MKIITFLLSVFLSVALISSCSDNNADYDATGTFEADEIIVSAEANGKLLLFYPQEGDTLKKEELVGIIDTTQLYLKKKQLEASIKAILSKQPDIITQLAALQKQIDYTENEKARIENLVNSAVVPSKQLDDIVSQLEVLKRQYDATKSNLTITKQALQNETIPLLAQIAQIEDQLRKSYIKNPVSGIVLTRYAKQNEVVSTGKALYKIADLSEMTLRAYISGNQLVQVKLGQKVKVFVDNGSNGKKEMSGEVYWISSKSEFTPKTIQTKEERINLVYAIKVKVVNDGFIKIGMYGEVKF
jgi:HlyD family secretion protein